ncbi:type I methionyl aminopeptidase [Klebsiella pneumoniae]|nr:type I methionyl aminopeptidase [Klebsiella pneumoniae]
MAISIKTSEDIEKMRVAGRLAAEVLEMIEPYVKPGVSTGELDRICNDYIVNEQKAISACLGYHGYPKSVCISVNEVVCHGIPDDGKLLKDGDIVNIDVTVIKDDFHGDTSKMFIVGKPTILGERLCRITQESLYLALRMVKPGINLRTIGAAIQADILVGNKPDSELLLLDVIPLSLGLETMGGLVEKVIPRNTTIPVARAQEFTTFKDGQTAMSIHVMQGERELVQDCRSLARFALRGIPALPAGGAHIRVTFQVDADGLLSVTAMEKSTGVEASIQVKPSYGLTDGEIATMIKDSMSYAEQDIQARMLAEQKVEAARVLESLTSALAADAALLSAAERQAIDAAAEQVRAAAAGDDADAIKEAIKNIDTQTQEFAARRMDQSVRIALKGQSVDEV